MGGNFLVKKLNCASVIGWRLCDADHKLKIVAINVCTLFSHKLVPLLHRAYPYRTSAFMAEPRRTKSALRVNGGSRGEINVALL